MDMIQLADLASEWIRAQREETDAQRLYNDPAIDTVIFLSMDDPETLWKFILEVLSRDDIDDLLHIVGAGPLEDLIAHHGEGYIERISIEAQSNGGLASALQFVWVNEGAMPSVDAYLELGCRLV